MKIKINGNSNEVKFKDFDRIDFVDSDIILSLIIVHQLENYQKHVGAIFMVVDDEDVPEEFCSEDADPEARFLYVMYKMIEGFKRHADANIKTITSDKDSLDESLRLFSKYFDRLWI